MKKRKILKNLLTALIFFLAVSWLTGCQVRKVVNASGFPEISSSPKIVFEVVSESEPKTATPEIETSLNKGTIQLSWPTSVKRFLDNFGVPTYYQSSGHTGLDFLMNLGTPIYAAGDGVVVFTGWFPQTPEYNYPDKGHGNTVWVLHGFLEDKRPLYSVYAHFSSFSVKVGEKVFAGQQIGLSGNTGASGGPHLHFAVRLGGGFQYGGIDNYGRSWTDGQWINPDEWIGQTLNLHW